jgi:arylformamidase
MWENLKKDELDRAYNNSLAVENSAEIIETWMKTSAQVRERATGEQDIGYGSHPKQSYDYFSAGDNSPIMVYIHGGWWQARSKDDFTFIVPPLIDLGFSVAMLGYRLAPDATMDQIVSDVRTGLSAIEIKIQHERGSFPGFHLLGWSAGAHLVTSVLNESNVKDGLCISGVYDLEPIRHCYVNDKLQLNREISLANSPIIKTNHFGKKIDLFVGSAELLHMQEQTKKFYEYRKRNAQTGEFQILNDFNHYTIFDELVGVDGAIYKSIKKRALS